MPVTTWITEEEKERYSKAQDDDLNELFQEVRAVTNKYYLCEIKANKKIISYTVYADTGHGEVQVIQFGTDVNKFIVMAFFFGVLAGIKSCQQQTP